MIFDLVRDYSDVLAAMPREHPRYRILKLLEEAIRRDAHFIGRHPTTLFQCMWNSCWWYDSPEAAGHYDLSERLDTASLPWEIEGWPVSTLLEKWHSNKERFTPRFTWLRSLRPPPLQLGTNQKMLLQGHRQKVYCVCYSPDGRLIVSGAGDQTVKVWDAASGVELFQIERYMCRMTSVCFSPDGRRIATGSLDDSWVTVHDASSGEQLFWFSVADNEVNRVCYSPDGQWLAATSENTVRVYRASDGDGPVLELQGHADEVRDVCFSPDGRRLAAASRGYTPPHHYSVRVWDATTGTELFQLAGGCGATGVCFSPDGRRLATGGESVRVWDATTGAELFEVGDRSRATRICFSPNGRHLAGIGPGQDSVLVWDADSRAELFSLSGHTDVVTGVCFSPNGRHLATSSYDATVRVWDVADGAEVFCRIEHMDEVNDLRFSPGGCWLGSTSGDEGTVRVWDASSGTEVLRRHVPFATCLSTPSIKLCFSRNGRRLAISSEDEENHQVHLWEAARGTVKLLTHDDRVSDVQFSPDGRWIVTESKDRVVRVWDASSGAAMLQLPIHFLECASFSPDGLLVTNSDDTTARVWDVAQRSEVLQLPGHTGKVACACFSTDGRRLATLAGAEVRVWNVSDGTELTRFRGGSSVCFSPDGRQLATVSSDRTVSVLSIPEGEELLRLQHPGRVKSACYSPEGRRLATISFNEASRVPGDSTSGAGEVRVWDPYSGAEESSLLRRHVTSLVQFSPYGQYLVAPGAICTWSAKPLEMEMAPSHEREKWVDFTEVWDVSGGSRVVVHTGSHYGDPFPFAAGTYPYQSLCQGFDVVLEEVATGSTVAALAVPSALGIHHTASPAGHTWAWSFGRFIYLATLEGEAAETRHGGPDRHPRRDWNCFRTDVPNIAGYEIFWHAEPLFRVSRVYRDFIQLDDNCTMMVLGSVACNRRDAARLVTRLNRSVREAIRIRADLGTILAEVNCASWWLGVDRFATLLLLVLDCARHELSIANAGHTNPWLCRSDGTVIELGKDNMGLPFNICEDFTYEVTKVELKPGSMVFAGSDSLLDMVSRAGEKFESVWLADALCAGDSTPAALGRSIVDRVHGLTTLHPERLELTALCLGRSRPT